MDRPRSGPGYRHHLVALLGYLALTLLMTYPLARQFAWAIPGDGFDGWQNVWNLWWVKQALLVEGSSPYFTRLLDFPDGVYLYFHTLNIFNGFSFLPFTLNGGPLVAYNVAVLFSFVAGGYGAYLLALYSLGRLTPCTWRRPAHLAAFLGGAVFTFAPYHMAHLLGHMQLISLEWLPFYALFMMAGVREARNQQVEASGFRGIRYVLIAALLLVLVAACDWYYAFYMALFTGLYWLWTIWRWRTWLAPTLRVAAIGLVFVVMTSPLLVPMLREMLRAEYMVPPPGSTEQLSADLTAFFTPSELHPVWGTAAAGWAGRFTASLSERTVFAGYSVLALALLALLAMWRAARFWGLSALIFAILALGPVLHIGGATRWGGVGPIPLPYALLHQVLPVLSISRSVSRFDVMVMLSLGILAALGLYWLLNRARRLGYHEGAGWLLAAIALGLVGLEFWVAPYPMSQPETQPFHEQLAQESGSFAVMDIPMDWDRPANLLYQTVHHKPMVSGYTSRTNPMSPAWRTPVLQTFRYLGPDIIAADPQQLAPIVLNDLEVRYVIVHKSDLPPGDYRETTLALVEEIFGEWQVVVDDNWLKVFRVPPAMIPLPYLTLAHGWGPREWRAGSPARSLAGPGAGIWVHLPLSQKVRLALSAYSLDGPARLEIRSGSELVGSYAIDSQATLILTPPLALAAGKSLVLVQSDAAPAPTMVTRIELIEE